MPPSPLTVNTTLTLPVFGEIEPARVVAVDDLFAVVADKFPVSPGHTVIVARRLVARFRDLTTAEKARLLTWIDWVQQLLATKVDTPPDAFNLGLNDGPAAGQTVPQFHFHVIPRYKGDVPDPRGGIRYVIPSRARYWEQAAAPSGDCFTKFDSSTSLTKPYRWIGNDDIDRHYHSLRKLTREPFDLALHWKTSSAAKPRLIGYYRLNLANLLRAGYIHLESPANVRIRFVHAADEKIYMQTMQKGAPRLLVGRYR